MVHPLLQEASLAILVRSQVASCSARALTLKPRSSPYPQGLSSLWQSRGRAGVGARPDPVGGWALSRWAGEQTERDRTAPTVSWEPGRGSKAGLPSPGVLLHPLLRPLGHEAEAERADPTAQLPLASERAGLRAGGR